MPRTRSYPPANLSRPLPRPLSPGPQAAVSNNHLVNAVRLVRHLAGQGQVQGACVGGPGLGQGQAPEQQVGVGQQHSHSHGTRDGAGGLPGDGHTAADGAQYQYSCQQQQQLPGHRPQHEHVGDEREGEDGQVPLQGQGHTQPGWRRAEQQQQQQQDEQQHQRERGRGQRSDGSGLDERHVQQRNSSEGGVGETGAGEGGGHGAAAAALPVGLLAPLALLRRRPAQLEAVRGALGGCEVLVGQGYYAAKARMMHCEQLLLRALRWQLPVPQPHGLALNAARCLRLPGGVQRLAVCLLNDLWCYTDMCLMGQGEREATTLAALEAACRACGHVVHVPSHAGEAVPGLGWWQLLGVAEGEEVFLGVRVRGVMEAVAGCHAVLGVGKAEGDHGRGEQ